MRALWSLLLAVALAAVAAAGRDVALAQEATTLETFALRQRSAEDLIPLLQPIVGPDGAVTGVGTRLIVRATKARMADIRKAIDLFDAPARSVRITVIQGLARDVARVTLEVAAAATLGDVRVAVGAAGAGPATPTASGVAARGDVSSSGSTVTDMQQIQVLEGTRGSIRIGESRPVRERTLVAGGGTAQVVESSRLVEAATGIWVAPRLDAERFVLDISSAGEQFDTRGNIQTQRIETTVSGRLGEWVSLGGALRELSAREAQIFGRQHVRLSEDRDVRVRVEELK